MFNPRPSSGLSHNFSKQSNISTSTDLEDSFRIRTPISPISSYPSPSKSLDTTVKDLRSIINLDLGRINTDIDATRNVIELAKDGICEKYYLLQLLFTLSRIAKFSSDAPTFHFVEINAKDDNSDDKAKRSFYKTDSRRGYFDQFSKGIKGKSYGMRTMHKDDEIRRQNDEGVVGADINGRSAGVYEMRRSMDDWNESVLLSSLKLKPQEIDMKKTITPSIKYKELNYMGQRTVSYDYKGGVHGMAQDIRGDINWKNDRVATGTASSSYESTREMGLLQTLANNVFPSSAKEDQSLLERILDTPLERNEGEIKNLFEEKIAKTSPVAYSSNFLNTKKDVLNEEVSPRLQWQYMDPHGIIHGPFPSEQMHQWYLKNFFPQNLSMRYTFNMPWTPFKDLYPPSTIPFKSLPKGYNLDVSNNKSSAQNLSQLANAHWSSYIRDNASLNERNKGSYLDEPRRNDGNIPARVNTNHHQHQRVPLQHFEDNKPSSLQHSPSIDNTGAKDSVGWKKPDKMTVSSLMEIMELQKKQSAMEAAKMEEKHKKPVQTGWNFTRDHIQTELSEEFPTLGTHVKSNSTRTKSSFIKQITMPLETFIESTREPYPHPNQTFASKVLGHR